MGKHEPMSNAMRAAKWRASMRAKGLRPKVLWLPDTSDPAWREEAARQSKLMAESDRRSGIQEFLDSVSILDDLPPYDWGDEGPP